MFTGGVQYYKDFCSIINEVATPQLNVAVVLFLNMALKIPL